MNKMKQIIVVRTDLNMRKGKMCAQAAHAAMLFICKRLEWDKCTLSPTRAIMPDRALGDFNEDEREWLKGAFTKVVVGGDSEEVLRALYAQAQLLGIEAHLMIDNGETEFGNVRTLTTLALGPARSDVLNQITGHLKLL